MENETKFPKLRVADVMKMTEEEAYEELEKRGLLQDSSPEDIEITESMTAEEIASFNSGCEEDEPFKSMLIDSIVIDENGVCIGEEGMDEKQTENISTVIYENKLIQKNLKTNETITTVLTAAPEFEIPDHVCFDTSTDEEKATKKEQHANMELNINDYL